MTIFKRTWLPFAVYVTAGVAFISLSGAAEGFLSLRLPLLLTALGALIHIAVLVCVWIGALFSPKLNAKPSQVLPLIGALALFASILVGFRIDKAALAESQHRGDAILSEVRRYIETNGKCPEYLEDTGAFNEGLPKPAYLSSEYAYSVNAEGECKVSFEADMFITCTRRPNEDDWYCDD
ncbi:MAG: hypothetical protein RIE56_07385 [Amphiplicatus sp.]